MFEYIMNDLTEAQQEFLKELQDYIKAEQRSPTTRELQEKLGLGSPRSIGQYLETLEEKGYIRRGQGARNIQILAPKTNVESYKTAKTHSETPRIFISYSHDNPSHKKWVAAFASRLMENGIEVILDQWDLGFGDDVARFMKNGVREASRVLVICTDTYIRKAEGGLGGVGFENLIVTAELLKDIGTTKFIPIVKDVSEKQKTPSFLETRLRIEVQNDNISDQDFDLLLRELHNLPKPKPPLGSSPFGQTPSGREIILSNRSKTLPTLDIVGHNPKDIYSKAIELARYNDVIGWRQLIKSIKGSCLQQLVHWRESVEADPSRNSISWQLLVDEAVEYISPILALALAGVESGRPEFSDQRALFDDLYNIPEWKKFGQTSLVKIPVVLGSIYQNLHGAMSLSTGQLDVALKFVDRKISYEDSYGISGAAKFIEHTGLTVGDTETTKRDCADFWKYLKNAPDRWDWLNKIFSSRFEYQVFLVAYHMVLNIFELITDLQDGKEQMIKAQGLLNFSFPIVFMDVDQTVIKKAISFLESQPEKLSHIWLSRGVSSQQVRSVWDAWSAHVVSWLGRDYRIKFRLIDNKMPHHSLIEAIE